MKEKGTVSVLTANESYVGAAARSPPFHVGIEKKSSEKEERFVRVLERLARRKGTSIVDVGRLLKYIRSDYSTSPFWI